MARKTTESPEQTSLAPRSNDGLAKSEADELAALFDFDFEADGLDEVDSEDLRFAVKVWNRSKKKPDSDDFFRVDEFFDTLTEQTSRTLDCVFVHLHKSNDFSYFDEAKDETVRVCSSYDRRTGRLLVQHPNIPNMPEGTERNCVGCADAEWVRDAKGKMSRNCGPVYGVFGVEIDEQGDYGAPFLMRFKRTSLKPFKAHLQKHHIMRMKDAKGRTKNVPFFAFRLRIRLQADERGKSALPVIEKLGLIPELMKVELADQARSFKEMAADVSRAAEKKESQYQTDAVETSGEPLRGDDFAD